MTETSSFELFPRLPTEIRLQIWREALFSVSAVWFALDVSKQEDYAIQWGEPLKSTGPAVKMVPLQSSLQVPISQVCVESRCLVEALLGITPQNVPVKWDPKARPPFLWDRRLFWTDWDTATIHLGNATNALKVVRFFCTSEMPLFKHISFEYDYDENVSDLTWRLKNLCPAVSTIAVFVDLEFPYSGPPVPQTSPTADMIRVLASIPSSSDTEVPQVALMTPHQRRGWTSVTCGNTPWLGQQVPDARYYRLLVETASL